MLTENEITEVDVFVSEVEENVVRVLNELNEFNNIRRSNQYVIFESVDITLNELIVWANKESYRRSDRKLNFFDLFYIGSTVKDYDIKKEFALSPSIELSDIFINKIKSGIDLSARNICVDIEKYLKKTVPKDDECELYKIGEVVKDRLGGKEASVQIYLIITIVFIREVYNKLKTQNIDNCMGEVCANFKNLIEFYIQDGVPGIRLSHTSKTLITPLNPSE